ncbi:MAG: GNAT family protein [Bacteroidota bacterium]
MTFDFTQDYFLEDEYVRLEPLQKQHVPLLHDLTLDPAIWTYFLEKGQGGKAYEVYINHALHQRQIKKEYPFVVFDKISKQYAGMTRLYEYANELKTIKLGHTWYGKIFRGTGINKRCKYLLFEFAFEELQVERIGFGAYATNTVSLAAMKSVGCQQEGVLRNLFPALDGNGRTDCALFSILKAEWSGTVKANLKNKISKLKTIKR